MPNQGPMKVPNLAPKRGKQRGTSAPTTVPKKLNPVAPPKHGR